MSSPRTTQLILPMGDLYQRLLTRIHEDVDACDVNEHLLYLSGYSLHHLLSWWIKYALEIVLALPISPLYREPMDTDFERYLKITLSEFETDVLGFAPLIRRLRREWVDVRVQLEPHRLTLEII